MIRIKLLSEPEYNQARLSQEHRKPEYEQVLQGKEYHEYYKGDFYDLLRDKDEFTDTESCALLRYMHGEAVVKEKLYRRVTPEGKTCMPAISEETKYGLVVIENSRHGIYTSFEHEFTNEKVEGILERISDSDFRDYPLVWDVFAALEMDILLTFRKKDFWYGSIPIDSPFVLENYPIDGVLHEVYVSKKTWQDTFDTYNGMSWIDNSFYHLEYQWQEDIDELIKAAVSALEYRFPDRTGAMTHWYSKQEIVDETLKAFATENRWTPILIIEEYHDGSYYLRTEAFKYPFYGELWGLAKRSRREDADVLLLPLDVEEPMSCAEDIKKAVCVFRVSGNEVLSADWEKGLYEFQKVLKKINEGDFRVEKIEEDLRWSMRLFPK